MQNEERLRADIVEVGHRLHSRAYNCIERREYQRLAWKRSSADDAEGRFQGVHDAGHDRDHRPRGPEGGGGAESVIRAVDRLAGYQNRPDVIAVVHAHPPTATGFAVAGIPLDRAVLAEAVTTLGSIPIADYGTPSTDELTARSPWPASCWRPITRWRGLSTSPALASWREYWDGSGCCRARR